MSGVGAISANALAAEVGVSQGTLSRWKRQAGNVSGMKGKRRGNISKATAGVRPKDRTPQEKLRLVIEAAGLGEEGLGEFLRREGIHEADLDRWRQSSLEGLSGQTVSKSEADRATKKARKLEKELRRKEKALAEAGALLVLQKKVRAIWGDEGDDT